jgi:hypothetical protein
VRSVAFLLLAFPLIAANAEVSTTQVSTDLPLAFVAGETPKQFSTVYRSAEISSEEVRIRTPKAAFSIVLRGARSVAGTAEAKLPGIANYYHGRDPKNWRTGLPTFSRVRFGEVYPGVSVVHYGTEQRLEFDLEVEPGAKLEQVELEFRGCQGVQKTSATMAMIRCGDEQIPFAVPLAYQNTADGKREPITAAVRIVGRNRLGFVVSGHDPTRAVVIDPTLTYSSYLVGSPTKVALDGSGNIFVAGDGFLRKLNSAGSAVLADTVFNGRAADIGFDGAGNVYVGGTTNSASFATTANAFQPIYVGPANCSNTSGQGPCSRGFASKFSNDGRTLTYSTYLGGQGLSFDHINAVAVNAGGEAFAAGDTTSLDFPLTPGSYQDAPTDGEKSAFVTRLNTSGSGLVYSTLMPASGIGQEAATDIVIDGIGNAYVGLSVLGSATIGNVFTPTPGALQISGGTQSVSKLNPSGSGLVYAAQLDGFSLEAIAIDSSGSVYLTGLSESGFVTTAGAFRTSQPVWCGNSSAGNPACACYARKISPAGDALVYSTLLGRAFTQDIAVDSAGRAIVAGTVSDPQFTDGVFDYPLVDSLQTQLSHDALVTKLTVNGSALVYSTLFGGSARELGMGLAVAGNDTVYVTGQTDSNDMLTTAGAVLSLPPAQPPQTRGFLIKLTDTPGVVPPNLEINLQPGALGTQIISSGETAGFFLQVTGRNLTDPVTFSCSNLPENSRCIFAPMSLTITGTGVQPVNLGIQTGVQSASVLAPKVQFAAMFLVGVFGLIIARSAKGSHKRQTAHWPALLAVSCVIALGCGGGGEATTPNTPNQPPPVSTPSQTRTVTVSAHSGNLVRSMQVSVTIR